MFFFTLKCGSAPVLGDEPETCAICLDDFIEGEKLRVLPCRHSEFLFEVGYAYPIWFGAQLYIYPCNISAYHCNCIDPWLTQNRKVCPMCKRRVGAKNSDSESSDEERRQEVLVFKLSCCTSDIVHRYFAQLQQPVSSRSTSITHTYLEDEERTGTPIGELIRPFLYLLNVLRVDCVKVSRVCSSRELCKGVNCLISVLFSLYQSGAGRCSSQ